MPAITKARRILMTLIACFALASVSIAPAFGAGAGAQTAVHHKKKHHAKHHAKKHRCAHPRADRDRDSIEPHGGNDGDGCGI